MGESEQHTFYAGNTVIGKIMQVAATNEVKAIHCSVLCIPQWGKQTTASHSSWTNYPNLKQ